MAAIYITEFNKLGWVGPGDSYVPAPAAPGVAEQTVAIGGTSTQSAAFNTLTRYVMINTDSICSLAFGSNPTAVTTAHRMDASTTRFYVVTAGQKVAVISNT